MHQSILIVGNFLSKKRGTRGVCEDLAVKLADNGWSVITTSDKDTRLARLVDMLKTTWQQRHHYSVAQIDVFSGGAFAWAEAVCRVLRWLKKPYVLTLHGGNLPAFAAQHSNRVTNLMSSATGITTPSGYLLEKMRPYQSGIQLLPNPLELENYTFKHHQGAIEPNLIWLRAFHDTYNPDLAIQVVAELYPDFPSIKLTMVGPDKGDGSFQRCQRLAIELGVAECIYFVGGVPKRDVPNWLVQGDIFLNTTNVDNTPVSVLEAMACGLGVVSTNVGGIPYLLDHQVNALLVPPDDAQAMSAAIRQLLLTPALANQLSTNARHTAEAFDWKVVLPQWEVLLRSVAANSDNNRQIPAVEK